MKIPKLKASRALASETVLFGGYCRSDACGENCFYDEENMSPSYFPALSSRPPRRAVSGPVAPTGIVNIAGSLCYTEGENFVIDGYSVDIGLTVDERIGDGYYFSKTVRILKKLIENPELLDEPMSKEVEV